MNKGPTFGLPRGSTYLGVYFTYLSSYLEAYLPTYLLPQYLESLPTYLFCLLAYSRVLPIYLPILRVLPTYVPIQAFNLLAQLSYLPSYLGSQLTYQVTCLPRLSTFLPRSPSWLPKLPTYLPTQTLILPTNLLAYLIYLPSYLGYLLIQLPTTQLNYLPS